MSASDDLTDGPLASFVRDLVAAEFPELPADRAMLTIEFCCDRCARLPQALRLGVRGVAGSTAVLGRIAGPQRVNRAVRRTRLPFVGDLARLTRSLAVAFIWERWPDTGALGAAGSATESVA